MMHQEEVSSSAYEASPAEVQSVILDWVKATEAFHHRYANLTEVINKMQANARRHPAQSKTRLRKLIMLRQHMSDVLMTLLLDMTGEKSGRSAQPSKPGQLRSHACLLDELNREIDTELTQVITVAQA
ncbi:hypothetical protein [Spirosoma utsteinense]|uniref:Uncharacterized protein n=1 Tax=Spirosoma utsteinense TaxID=2585773 RepID=A0ABR6W4Q9_9BACT|nr:hypothetical protein [Spirosoma utsteinense]MBC3784300.1 hypothetical protein [Spirosoma utsteinense]MBC3790902.1 hypothetical protein [Spirosoma utsteinense]